MAGGRTILARFTDDRGRPVGLAIGSSSEDVLDALHGQKRALLDRRFDVGTAIVTIAAMLVAAPMVVFNLGLLGLILGFIAALIGVRLAFHAFFESPVLLTRGYVYIHQVVRAGFCPSCDYRIGEIEASADGMLVCPECGAAWRVPRPTRAPPLACPRCRYPLAGLPQEPPGVVTCPECGEVVVGVRRDEQRASGSG